MHYRLIRGIMTDIFSVDKKTLDQLTKYFQRLPENIKPATAAVLNGQAFGTRTTSIKTIGKQMTVRNPAFVSRSLRVTKASYRQPIDQQQARLYTTSGTGWTEQEFGAKNKSTRTIQGTGKQSARTAWNKPISSKYRYNKDFHKMSQYKFRNKGEAARWGYIAYMKRSHNGEPFILDKKTGSLDIGALVFKDSKLHRLSFHKANHSAKKRPWMQPSAAYYTNSTALARIWQKELQRLFNKRIN